MEGSEAHGIMEVTVEDFGKNKAEVCSDAERPNPV